VSVIAARRWSFGANAALAVVGVAWIFVIAAQMPWFVTIVPPVALSGAILIGRRAALAERNDRLREQTDLSTRLDEACDLARLGTWHWDIRLGRVHYDRRCAAMLGYADGEIASTLGTWGKLVHPDDLAAARDAIDALIDGCAEQYEVTVRLRAADGTWRTILDRGRVTSRDDKGRATRAIGIHLDITETRVAAAPPVITRGRWVIVDDDESVRTVIQAAARRLGLDAVAFADPIAAWEAIGAGPPIGIITDFEMPGMTGVQLAERVRAAGLGCPLLLVTGAESPSLSECRAIDGLLGKPFSIASLEKWLSRHTGRERQTSTAR